MPEGFLGIRRATGFASAWVPVVATLWTYFVTAEDGSGSEGTLGFTTGAERSNFAACP